MYHPSLLSIFLRYCLLPGENPTLPSQSCPSVLLPSPGKSDAFQVPGTNKGPTNTQLCPPVLQPPAHPLGIGALPCHSRHIFVSLKTQSEGIATQNSSFILGLDTRPFPEDKPPQSVPEDSLLKESLNCSYLTGSLCPPQILSCLGRWRIEKCPFPSRLTPLSDFHWTVTKLQHPTSHFLGI